jgi:hypothetical protein
MRPGTRRRQPRSPKALLSCRRVVLLLLAVVVAVLDGREVGFALAQQHDDGGADTPVDPIELVRAEAEGGDAAKGGGSSSSADDESAAKIAADAKIKAALGDAGAGAGGGGGDAAGATTDTETKKASGGDAAAAAAAAEIEEDPYANLDFSEMNDLDFDLEPGEDAYADDTGVDGEGMPDGGDDDDRDLEANFHMTEFAPSHVFTFPLGARQEECFFEDILRVPLKLRGAYFVASGASLEVDFAVKRASNTDVNSKTTIYEKRGQTESMFHAMAETPGQYSFCFSNRDSTQDKMVTFALHVGTRKPEVRTCMCH